MKSPVFNDLNAQQKEAVFYSTGPSIILAGAGSGKTRVLTSKVLQFIGNEVNPENILMVTFTNKAAQEMKDRVKKKLGFIGTFHSFCVKVLRRDGFQNGLDPNFVIYDAADQESVIKDILKSIDSEKKLTPSFVLAKISQAKDQLIKPAQYRKLFTDRSSEIIGHIYEKYQKILDKNHAVDFDDLLFKTAELFLEHRDILEKYQKQFTHILVDEFQDTNYAQYVLTKLLGQGSNNLTVVGDFSQSIYSWRGAEIRNLEKLKNDFSNVKTFYLEQNYRSTQKILDFAYDVISKNHTHPILKVFTEKLGGDEVDVHQLHNEQYEALFIADEAKRLVRNNGDDYNSIAVLYRINAQSRVIEEAFLHVGVPYVLIGGTRFYERREIKDILSYLRLVVNPDEEVSLKRVLKIGKKRFENFREIHSELKGRVYEIDTVDIVDKILDKTRYIELFKQDLEDDLDRLENIKELRSVAINYPKLHDFLEQVALVESEYSENEKKQKGKAGVYMMTLHQAKGLEFPYVFITGVEDGILPHSRSFYDLHNMEEERRLFYVGITRAREKLYITHTEKRFFFGRRTQSQISRFLEDDTETYDYQNY